MLQSISSQEYSIFQRYYLQKVTKITHSTTKESAGFGFKENKVYLFKKYFDN